MKPVRFHPDLDTEVQEAARFYEDRQTGLGSELLRLIEQTTKEIRRAPMRCQFVARDVRKRRLARFPFAPIFENQSDCIYIVALMHHRRHPDYWKNRVGPA